MTIILGKMSNFIFVFLVSFGVVLFANTLNDGVEERIVGGFSCSTETYPFVVSIRYSRRKPGKHHMCGGSLVSLEWVLTAAHCIARNLPPKEYIIVGGIDDMTIMDKYYSDFIDENRKEYAGQASVLSEIVVHEKFDPITQYADIALLRLAKKFLLSMFVIPVKLPKLEVIQQTSIYRQKECLTLGWGHHQDQPYYNKDPTNLNLKHLQCVYLPLISPSDCVSHLKQIKVSFMLSNGQICTMFKAGGKDACQGDSGGPLICNGLQHGIVSGGFGCAQPNTPAIFTEIDYFLPWLQTVLTSPPYSREIVNRSTIIIKHSSSDSHKSGFLLFFCIIHLLQ